jgi:hypothetical protein
MLETSEIAPAFVMPRPMLIAMGVSSFMYVVLCLHLPVALFSDGLYDDALFATHAAFIYSGHWLGPYDLRTFIKGPGFPLFLAVNAILGLPINFTLALFYSSACIFFTWCLYRLTGVAWLTFVLFLAIEWHPSVFPIRVTRDDISPGQVLLVLGCVIQFAMLAWSARQRLIWAVAAGSVFSWYWMTREDVIWVVPGVGFILAAQLFLAWRRREGLGGLAAAVGVYLFAAFALYGAVATINFADYGAFQTEDIKSPAFERAVKDLQAVRVGPAVPFVPVPQTVRHAIDAVSPAFAALEPYFDGPGKGWKLQSCSYDKPSCGELAGGWFVFALRDAVAWDGHYGSPRQAADYFRLIAQQIETACRIGQLTCTPGIAALMPAVTASQWAKVPHIIAQIYDKLSLQSPLELAEHSTGNATQMQAMENILNRPRRTPSRSEENAAILDGWFVPKTDAWVQLRCSTQGHDEIIPIPRLPSQDLVAYFKNPALVFDRFNIAVPAAAGCGLQIANGDGEGAVLGLDDMKPGPAFLPAGELYIGSIIRPTPSIAGAGAQHVLLALRWPYRIVFPIAGLAAIACYLRSLILLFRGRAASRLLVLATGLWILLLSRCGILLLVDVAAFPAISQVYMLPAYTVSCMAFAVSIALPFLPQAAANSPGINRARFDQ